MQKNIDIQRAAYNKTRRDFLRTTTRGLGALAMGTLIAPNLLSSQTPQIPSNIPGHGGILQALHHAPKGKTGDLFISGRWAEPDRAIRLQARIDEALGQGNSG